MVHDLLRISKALLELEHPGNKSLAGHINRK